MKKIMFSDRYGLTQAVLDGRKTMTRRIVPQSVVDNYMYDTDPTIIDAARFEVGEVVAIAQSYIEAGFCGDELDRHKASLISRGRLDKSKGWANKMFVRADAMPHHIRITDIKVERLQDISDEDCLKEGVYVRTERHPRQVFEPEYTFGDGGYHARYPVAAFGAMIYGIYSKDTWNSSPWCFCYEFELID